MRHLIRIVPPTALAAVLAPAAPAQVVYSVDWKGPTIAQQDSSGIAPITEADLVQQGQGTPAFGPLPPPTIVLTGGALGLARYTQCVGHAPGVPCGVEVDALSAGLDPAFGADAPGGLDSPGDVWLSVDEWAGGLTPPGSPGHASLDTEAAADEASADLFVPEVRPQGPTQPPFPFGHAVGVIDGDGLPSASGFVYPGLGVKEPNPASPGLPNLGDNLDALDIGFPSAFPPDGVLFSLDAGFGDPREGIANSGSALFEGVSPASVLRTATAGGPISVYAPAPQLGLDRMGTATDDLDALIVHENGDFVYTRSQVPFDWLPGPGGAGATSDMVLFSVRRGSAVIGMPDSLWGQPIEEGDVLTTPLPTSMGGLSPFPGIFLPAESLGLRTVRSGTAQGHGDDANALDLTLAPCFDCNKNGVEDAVDIATGYSTDVDMDGVPDECQEKVLPYCYCGAGEGPCGNDDPGAGCANSTGSGGFLDLGAGTTSVSADDLVLVADQLPVNRPGIFFMGGGTASAPFGDGQRCVVSGGQGVHRYPVGSSGPTGELTLGPGIAAFACGSFPPAACIEAGDVWYLQAWYRDPAGACGSNFNLSNGVRVEFVP